MCWEYLICSMPSVWYGKPTAWLLKLSHLNSTIIKCFQHRVLTNTRRSADANDFCVQRVCFGLLTNKEFVLLMIKALWILTSPVTIGHGVDYRQLHFLNVGDSSSNKIRARMRIVFSYQESSNVTTRLVLTEVVFFIVISNLSRFPVQTAHYCAKGGGVLPLETLCCSH